MKSLEIQAKKRLLIVERPEGKSTEEALSEYESKDKWKFLVFGSDLTEEMASELVEMGKNSYGEIKYQNYYEDIGAFMGYEEALPSLISLIESLGWHWGQHPLGEEPKREEYEKDVPVEVWEKDFLIDNGEWKEAESRTFHPEKVLIFEIVEGQS